MIEVVGSVDEQRYLVAFSPKASGNMSATFGDAAIAKTNASRFVQSVGVNVDRVHFIRPAHSNRIMLRTADVTTHVYEEPQILDCDFKGYRDGCDGAVAIDSDSPLAIITGDCIPLVLWSSHTRLYGIIHVGFVNLVNGIVRALAPLLKNCGVSPENLNCYFGPSITKAHYDLAQSGLWRVIAPQVQERSPVALDYMRQDDDAIYMDMHALLRDQLELMGIRPDRIRAFPVSTADNDSHFFSNFRARHTTDANGRFLTLIAPASHALAEATT